MKRVSVAEKVVAITGGARGIGFATATLLHGLGAKVAIGDIDRSAVREAASQLALEVGRRLDVTDRRSFTDFLDTVEDRLGPVDVLVNNAGVIAVGSAVDEADTTTQRLLDVNIYGVILGTKLAVKRMLPRGHGHIVNIASVGSVLPTEGIATYCATKHAMLGYTDTVRMENRGSGVQFSAILPTLTNTEMIAGVGHARGLKNAEPDDVARAIAGVIAKPKAHVFVPRSLGVAVATQRFMPRRVAEAMARASGKGRVFTSDVEVDKRTAYARRTGTS
jgi:short-subunit dehydrogenase